MYAHKSASCGRSSALPYPALRRLLGDPLAAAHIGAAVIHGVDRDQLSVLAVFDREARRSDVADRRRVIIALAQARHLQLELILVRPEPRHGIIELRLAENR